jgi:hypothetical protein
VGHAGPVLEDPHAGFEQLAVAAAARQTHHALIGVGAGHHERELDAAARRPDDRTAERLVRQEVRRRDAHAATGALDQHLDQDA